MDTTLAQIIEELVAMAQVAKQAQTENAALKQKVAELEKAQSSPDKALS